MHLYPDHEMARLQQLEEEVFELEKWLRNNASAGHDAIREQRRRYIEKQSLINEILNSKQNDTSTKNH